MRVMKWQPPPLIKIYEALGAVADGRVHVSGDTAQVYSSSGNKYYDVSYDHAKNAIMANDNGSYWKGYLGYPAIAYLLAIKVLEYQPALATSLKSIPWKDLNQKYKNDFDKTLAHILVAIPEPARSELESYASSLQTKASALNLSHLGKKPIPPQGY